MTQEENTFEYHNKNLKYIPDMVDLMSVPDMFYCSKCISFNFSDIFWLGGNMNAQIYSDRVDLTSETYFIQILTSESLRIPLWQREVVNIKYIEV